MKNVLLMTIVLFLSAFAQEPPATKTDTPYKTGEFFKFKISYSRFLTAGYATMELTEATYNNKQVYYAKGYGANSGLSKAFFKVEDHYQSYFDKETGKPYMAVRNISEGNYRRNQRAYFNHNSHTVYLRDLLRNKDEVIDVPVNVQDVVSMFYYFRNHKDIDRLKEGQSIEVDMFFDDEIMKFKLKFVGREVIKTKFGQVPAMIFRPMVQTGRVFREEESLTVWVSDDQNKVPLRIKADILVGSINADLTEYKGLKYPLKIQNK